MLKRLVKLYTGKAAEWRLARLGIPPMRGGQQHQSLFDDVLVRQTINPQSANNITINGASVDMQGWDYVDFVFLLGATDTTVDAKLQDSADGTTFADIPGVSIAQLSATDDNKLAILSFAHKEAGARRYVRGPVTIGAGTAGAVVSALAIRYGPSGGRPSRSPVAQEATTHQLTKK